MTKSEKLFERAVKRIPGGVNSPVRAYGAIGEAPRFIERADGCYIYDVVTPLPITLHAIIPANNKDTNRFLIFYFSSCC